MAAYASTRKKTLTVAFKFRDKDAPKGPKTPAPQGMKQWAKVVWYVYRHEQKPPRAYDRPFAEGKIPAGWWFAGKVAEVSRKTALARAKHGLLPV